MQRGAENMKLLRKLLQSQEIHGLWDEKVSKDMYISDGYHWKASVENCIRRKA